MPAETDKFVFQDDTEIWIQHLHCTHIPTQVVSVYVLLEPEEKQLGLRKHYDRQAVAIDNSFQTETMLLAIAFMHTLLHDSQQMQRYEKSWLNELKNGDVRKEKSQTDSYRKIKPTLCKKWTRSQNDIIMMNRRPNIDGGT